MLFSGRRREKCFAEKKMKLKSFMKSIENNAFFENFYFLMFSFQHLIISIYYKTYGNRTENLYKHIFED